jgi:pyruvate dehydrogenase (quinone)
LCPRNGTIKTEMSTAQSGIVVRSDLSDIRLGPSQRGSTHLVAGLYEVARDHAPVLALSGDMPRKMHGTDFIQTTEPDLLFRDVSLYTETVAPPAQAAAVIHQAIAAAYATAVAGVIALPRGLHRLTRLRGTVPAGIVSRIQFL